VIVVDDGSPDSTRQVAAAFGDRIVYIGQTNKGLSGARNAGIRAARGEYIALLDSDDVCLPGRLRAQAAILDAHPKVGIVVGEAHLYDGEKILGLKSTISGQPKNKEDFRWETVEHCATPSTAMIRRECFQTIGYFDERVRGGVGSGGEDWLFFVQQSLRYQMVYLDSPVILYRIHPGSGTQNVEGVNAGNRLACAAAVNWECFPAYPAHFRARLLFYRGATAWRVEPKSNALTYFLRALATDPRQMGYGLQVVRQGLSNTLRRRRTSP
jgi:glycosyltransferase involved in cell wall biosynthesis